MTHLLGLDLMVFQWRRRLLLLFSPSQEDPGYEQQISLLDGQEAALAERDLLLVHLFTDEPSRLGDERLPCQAAEQMRARFGVDAGTFTVVLIGLDGTEKRRRARPMGPGEIYGAIDAMPVRQLELERRGRR